MKYNSEHILKSQKGSTSSIIIVSALLIMIIAASIADVGYAVYQQFALVSVTKQAAIKGAEALLQDKNAAEQAIKLNITKKVKDLTKLNMAIPDNCREITVSVRKPFEYFFVKYLGAYKNEITSKITVRLTGVMGITNVRPFGVSKKDFVFGKSYTLTNSTKNTSGNALKIVSLQLGADKFINTVILGYTDKLNVNDTVNEYSGMTEKVSASVKKEIDAMIGDCNHNPACTFEKYENNCSRIIILPVLSDSDKNGQYKISGFTAFFIEKSAAEGDCFYITGRFIKHAVKADMSDGVQNFGLAAIRVIDN